MSEKNYKKLDHKLLRSDKQFCYLKQLQKEKINEGFYQGYCKECIENNNNLDKNSFERILHTILFKIEEEQI